MKRPHFALPEIYDDSLSYYDVLRKLIKSMNVIIDNLNKIPEQIANEAKARLLGDQNLQQNINSEATTREQADQEIREGVSDKISELKGDLDEFGVQLSDLVGVEGNLIDKSSVVDDSYIDAEGNVKKASGFFCTDYIPVLENKSYYWASLYIGYYAFYDSEKKFIDGAKGSSNLTNPFTTPIGTAYARFTALNQEAMANAWIYEENRRPSDYKKVVKMPLKSESIGEYNLIDSSVTESKIANNSVSEAKIADKCIGTEKIKNYSVEPKVTTFIVHDDETDFIDGWEKDKYINAQGQLTNYEGFYATEPIYLSENTTYYWDRFRNGYYAFYDAEGNVIESHGDDGSLAKPFVTPTGTVFARFTAIREDQTRYSWISTQNKKPDKYGYMLDKSIKVKSEEFDNSYCNYNGNEVCMFTKGLCIGDSLTEGTFNYYLDGSIAHYKNISKYSYPSIFQRLTGIPMTNKGHGGMTSIQWYEAEKDNTFSDYDFAIIQLGVNDAIQIGSWTQEVETAFRNIITKLKSENKGIKIFVSTITPSIDYSGEQFDRITTGIRSFVSSLNDDNVILLDMAIYSSLGDTKAYNCGHYTAYGYWRLAQDYKNYIGYVMNTNKLVFRNVQFINTDYEVNP